MGTLFIEYENANVVLTFCDNGMYDNCISKIV